MTESDNIVFLTLLYILHNFCRIYNAFTKRRKNVGKEILRI
uniref:Uncharacterized protein n=1 Tax=Klebsiella pneumoniae TaxID=573 RepID=A0A6M6A5A5_KLEPN|nr:hypothetical protein [Klebsiella pneumoniae]